MQHAIALQQYHFQQSLLNQQILAQQQAAANSASMKAAVEEAAARAAQISKILSGENAEQEKEKSQQSSPRRERAEPLPRLRSRSMSLSSKSESASPSRSPISYKHGRTEHGRYSSRDYSYRRSRRYSQYSTRGYDHGNYYRSSYRRDFDHRYHDRGYLSCHRSRGRSRRRSRSRSRLSLSRSRERHYNERSLSPQRHPNRCSPKSDSSSKEQACRISKSPVKSNSFISHLENSKSRSEEKHTDEGRLTPSRSSGGGRHTTGSSNGDDDGVTSVGKNEKSKHVYICHKDVASSPDNKLTENGCSSYSPISSDHSAGKVTRGMQRSSMLASYSFDSGNHASPQGSIEAMASRSPGATEEENILPSPHKRVHHNSSNNHKNANSDDALGYLDALNCKRLPEVKVRGHPGHDKHKNVFQADNVVPKRRSNTEVVKHKLSHLKEEPGFRQNMENFDEGIRSSNDEGLVAYSQIYQIREERSEDLVASTKKTFSDHKTGYEYLVARQGAMVSLSSETGEDMNKNLMPYPTAGDESNALEKIDDDQWGKIAIKGHGKKRSRRRSKTREKNSKHHKKHYRKHRREELKKNNSKLHKKHREEESESEKKSYKRNRRENSEEGDKHHKRHRRDDSEGSEEKHHKKNKRADSEEEDFVGKRRSRSTKKNKNYARHKHGHRERRRRKRQATSSSSSSSEHLPSSVEISDDVPSKKSAGYKGSKSSP